jgi:REP element-mobilizing transposase RayT
MKYNPDIHQRRSIRLKGYDYTQEGLYFITICVKNHECLFGKIDNGIMELNNYGEIANNYWIAIQDHFLPIDILEFVVMPNHIHGILMINDKNIDERHVGARHAVPLQFTPQHNRSKTEQYGKPVPGSIPTIIRSYKSAVTKKINEINNIPGSPVWQRNYYEHIIRDEKSYHQISEYIGANPLKWQDDKYYA